MPRQIIYAILSWFYQLILVEFIFEFIFSSGDFIKGSFFPRDGYRRREGESHLIFTIARRFLNGQTEPGAAKSDRWMSRTVCRRPARWAPFFSTWPGYWPTLVSPDSLSFSPTGFTPQSPSPRSTCPLDGPCPPRSGYPFLLFKRASVKRGIASTINDLHHRTGHHHRSSSKAPLMT